MDLKNALKEIEKLKQIIDNKDVEIEKLKLALYKQQKELNEALITIEVTKDKYKIQRTKAFLGRSEKLSNTIINEVEEVISETKKIVGRNKDGKNFANIDLSKYVSETIYEDPASKICEKCNGELVIASSKERFIIEVVPSTIKIIKIVKRSYKCPICNKNDNKLYYPLVNEAFPGSILTSSLASYIAYHKYELGIPFHHLERHIKETIGIPISKQLMSYWMSSLANKLEPLYNKMRLDLLNNTVKIIHTDETTLVVSKKNEINKDRKVSYVYVYASSYYDRQIQIYDFHENRSIDKTTEWLKDYEGYIVCDDYKGYDKLARLNPNIKLQRCFAHARRRFMDILKTIPKEQQSDTLSFKILELINKLFHFENEYKKLELIASKIVVRRKIDQLPILNTLKEYIFNKPVKKDSSLENAVKYVRNIWDDLNTYLECGYLEISNNLAERAVKPFVINRKVFMTSGSYVGARYTTIIFSIIRTALINGLNVERYLEYIINNIGEKDINKLLPYFDELPNYLKS